MKYFPDGPGNLPSNAGDSGLIPGWGTKIPHVSWYSQKEKKRKTLKHSNSQMLIFFLICYASICFYMLYIEYVYYISIIF